MKHIIKALTFKFWSVLVLIVLLIVSIILYYQTFQKIKNFDAMNVSFNIFRLIQEDNDTVFMSNANNYFKVRGESRSQEELYLLSKETYILHFYFDCYGIKNEDIIAKLDNQVIELSRESFNTKFDFSCEKRSTSFQNFVYVKVTKDSHILTIKNKKTNKTYYTLSISNMKPQVF